MDTKGVEVPVTVVVRPLDEVDRDGRCNHVCAGTGMVCQREIGHGPPHAVFDWSSR